ncbi:hypothetical protein SRHO_G00115430 [Serrasalmus rhombeus]
MCLSGGSVELHSLTAVGRCSVPARAKEAVPVEKSCWRSHHLARKCQTAASARTGWTSAVRSRFALRHLYSGSEMQLSPLRSEKQVSSTMGEGLEKTPTTPEGPGDVERAWSPACRGSGLKPLGNGCLWRTGVAVLITGAGLILLGAIGAFHLWKDSGKQVISVHYSVSLNGKQADASMEIDSANNLERIRTGSGDGEAVEVHDFQAGVTAVWFFGEDKCYIRSQTKAKLPELGTSPKDSVTIQLRRQDSETGTLVFDPMLDHRGICCSECQHGHTHCERICEPLGGYWPWPYNYRGCRVACRVILPCRWWAARMMGLV